MVRTCRRDGLPQIQPTGYEKTRSRDETGLIDVSDSHYQFHRQRYAFGV